MKMIITLLWPVISSGNFSSLLSFFLHRNWWKFIFCQWNCVRLKWANQDTVQRKYEFCAFPSTHLWVVCLCCGSGPCLTSPHIYSAHQPNYNFFPSKEVADLFSGTRQTQQNCFWQMQRETGLHNGGKVLQLFLFNERLAHNFTHILNHRRDIWIWTICWLYGSSVRTAQYVGALVEKISKL